LVFRRRNGFRYGGDGRRFFAGARLPWRKGLEPCDGGRGDCLWVLKVRETYWAAVAKTEGEILKQEPQEVKKDRKRLRNGLFVKGAKSCQSRAVGGRGETSFVKITLRDGKKERKEEGIQG